MKLTPSQYVVLGLAARHGPLTPYALKAYVAESVGFYWPIPHAQLYRDAPALAALGLLEESAEPSGRRRRRFGVTQAGLEELRAWLADDGVTETQIKDPALLKLAFAGLGASTDLAALARTQEDTHRAWAERYAARAALLEPDEAGVEDRRRVLELGRAIEEAYVTYWSALAGENPRTRSA